jgi:hypothetical protein
VIKSMFLLLQILFELKQSTSAWPVISFIDMKLKEQTSTLQLKQNIKAQPIDTYNDG